jgi:hypothetical protein
VGVFRIRMRAIFSWLVFTCRRVSGEPCNEPCNCEAAFGKRPRGVFF